MLRAGCCRRCRGGSGRSELLCAHAGRCSAGVVHLIVAWMMHCVAYQSCCQSCPTFVKLLSDPVQSRTLVAGLTWPPHAVGLIDADWHRRRSCRGDCGTARRWCPPAWRGLWLPAVAHSMRLEPLRRWLPWLRRQVGMLTSSMPTIATLLFYLAAVVRHLTTVSSWVTLLGSQDVVAKAG